MEHSIIDHMEINQGRYLKTKDSIVRFVEQYVSLNKDLKSKNRNRKLVDERKYLMGVLDQYTDLTLVQIAAIFGKHHSTVIYHVNCHKNLIEIMDKSYEYNTRSLNELKLILPL